MRVRPIDPAGDADLAQRLLSLQRAAYAAEAALIGDDRIPPLHETIAMLRSASLRWLGAIAPDGRLVGAVAWTEQPAEVSIDRLVVDPAVHRRGVGRALVLAVLSEAGNRLTTVSTGRANEPARSLYERLGFDQLDDSEVEPGLWVTHLARTPAHRRWVEDGRCSSRPGQPGAV